MILGISKTEEKFLVFLCYLARSIIVDTYGAIITVIGACLLTGCAIIRQGSFSVEKGLLNTALWLIISGGCLIVLRHNLESCSDTANLPIFRDSGKPWILKFKDCLGPIGYATVILLLLDIPVSLAALAWFFSHYLS